MSKVTVGCCHAIARTSFLLSNSSSLIDLVLREAVFLSLLVEVFVSGSVEGSGGVL